ncbi:MAG: ADOP family duplicated permease [Candidatus Sulfotelmatobacter sp.]
MIRFAVCSVLSIGLGTATLLYTALDRLILHPLSIHHPETLVLAAETRPPITSWQWFPYSTYQAVLKMHSFVSVAVDGSVDTVLTEQEGATPVLAQMVSTNYFQVLGVAPERGNAFSESGPPSVVLSHSFWITRLGGSPTVVGQILRVQGVPLVVTGVMPKQFYGLQLDSAPDLWIPLSAQPLISSKSLNDPEPDRHFSIIARLGHNITLTQAQQEFATLFRTLQKERGEEDPERIGRLLPVKQGTFALRDQFSHALALLLWGVALLLFLTCANVAGLLIVRGLQRERDNAVRLALGASRFRILWNALASSTALGLSGGMGGILLAYVSATRLLRLLPPTRAPIPANFTPNVWVSFGTLMLALTVSVTFGAFPAFLASRVAPQQALRGGSATRKTGVLSRSLLVVQTALTLVLLVSGGLLSRTYYILRHTDPGFDAEHIVVFSINPSLVGNSVKLSSTFRRQLLERINALPGVKSASLASFPLMKRLGAKASVSLPGEKIPSDAFLNASMDSVSSSFFEAMGLPIRSGRSLSPVDGTRSDPIPTVINSAFARLLFPNQDPIGRSFGTGSPGEMASATNVVVGVVGDSKYRSLREPFLPIYYDPIEQREDWDSKSYLYVRTANNPSSVIQSAHQVLAALAPQIPFSSVDTMVAEMADSLWQERLLSVLALVFSVMSVLMVLIGLYSFVAYDTSQRNREFAIRCALGAQKVDMTRLLAKEVAFVLVPGMALGLTISWALSRFLVSILYGVNAFDLVSVLTSFLVISASTAVATFVPIVRTRSIEPAVVLRNE